MKEITEIKKYLTIDEKIILRQYQTMSDEELLEIIRSIAMNLDRLPTKQDVELAWYFKSRFGAWPRLLEKAGLKPVSETHQRRKAANKRKKQNAARTRSAKTAQKTKGGLLKSNDSEY